MLADMGRVFLKIKLERFLCFGITVAHLPRACFLQPSSWHGHLCAVLSFSIDSDGACWLLPWMRALTARALCEQRITLIQEHAVATMVTYLSRNDSSCCETFFPVHLLTSVGMN